MRRVEEFTKRTVDVLASFAGLLLLSPVLLVLSILIRLDSKGPAIYKSLRIGQHGNPFPMWKFRTMQLNSEAQGLTTGKDDPRITGLGGVLRKYKIDELPQLFNVLKGDMSLVGPRPDFEEHTSAIKVMLVNPGPLRTRMRATAMPGEDPLTLRTPDELAPKLVMLTAPEWRETGKLYDFPHDQVMSFAAPA